MSGRHYHFFLFSSLTFTILVYVCVSYILTGVGGGTLVVLHDACVYV